MNRSQNREQAFKLLYSMTFLDEELDIDEQIKLFLDGENLTNKNTIEYVNSIIKGVDQHIMKSLI